MTITIITANTWAYDDPMNEVVIPDWVKPFLAQAGYLHISEAQATTPQPADHTDRSDC